MFGMRIKGEQLHRYVSIISKSIFHDKNAKNNDNNKLYIKKMVCSIQNESIY